LITQTEEYDDEFHLPPFSKRAESYGFGAEEVRDRADVTFALFKCAGFGRLR
jgi:hypothetical protein